MHISLSLQYVEHMMCMFYFVSTIMLDCEDKYPGGGCKLAFWKRFLIVLFFVFCKYVWVFLCIGTPRGGPLVPVTRRHSQVSIGQI